jgi:protein SCO1/2
MNRIVTRHQPHHHIDDGRPCGTGAQRRFARLTGMARLLCAALATLLLGACGPGAGTTSTTAPALSWHGAQLTRPTPKPDVTLTDTSGHPFAIRADTQGRVLLLYFGYTHCPDQCPADMATLANALKTLTPQQRSAITVAFVTTDPARDTAPVLRAFLDRFDKSFIGLLGTPAQVEAAQRGAGVTLATTETLTPAPSETPLASGTYFIDHAAYVLAYSRDGLAHEAFPGGVAVNLEAADIGQMADGGTPYT